jgi:acyl-CoA thioesterase YciA
MSLSTSAAGPGPRGELAIRVLAIPSDTNPNGDIFGGWVVSLMDNAGGIIARNVSRGRAVTIAIDGMSFIRPVGVGDVLCVYAALERIGRTSMTVHVEAWAQRFLTEREEKVTDATFTFVAVDDAGRPRPVVRAQAEAKG